MVASDHTPGHRISLQGAWEPPSAGVRGWSRSFGRPVDLPAGERVDLVIVAPGPVLASVTLNGHPVDWRSRTALAAEMVRGRLDVTADLAARNELRLHADPGPGEAKATGGCRGTLPDGVARVWLEIHVSPPSDHP